MIERPQFKLLRLLYSVSDSSPIYRAFIMVAAEQHTPLIWSNLKAESWEAAILEPIQEDVVMCPVKDEKALQDKPYCQ